MNIESDEDVNDKAACVALQKLADIPISVEKSSDGSGPTARDSPQNSNSCLDGSETECSDIVFGWEKNAYGDNVLECDSSKEMHSDFVACDSMNVSDLMCIARHIESSTENVNSNNSQSRLDQVSRLPEVTRNVDSIQSDDESVSSCDESLSGTIFNVEMAEDEEDFDNSLVPPRTLNEIDAEIELIRNEQLLMNEPTNLIGKVFSIIRSEGCIIVRGSCSPALDEGSILCVSNGDGMHSNRFILGCISEVFGPVQFPYYSIRIDTKRSEVWEKVFIDQNVYSITTESKFINIETLITKGCDASNKNDEEVFPHEMEFSDDEEERKFCPAQSSKSKKGKKKNRKQSNSSTPAIAENRRIYSPNIQRAIHPFVPPPLPPVFPLFNAEGWNRNQPMVSIPIPSCTPYQQNIMSPYLSVPPIVQQIMFPQPYPNLQPNQFTNEPSDRDCNSNTNSGNQHTNTNSNTEGKN